MYNSYPPATQCGHTGKSKVWPSHTMSHPWNGGQGFCLSRHHYHHPSRYSHKWADGTYSNIQPTTRSITQYTDAVKHSISHKISNRERHNSLTIQLSIVIQDHRALEVVYMYIELDGKSCMRYWAVKGSTKIYKASVVPCAIGYIEIDWLAISIDAENQQITRRTCSIGPRCLFSINSLNYKDYLRYKR